MFAGYPQLIKAGFVKRFKSKSLLLVAHMSVQFVLIRCRYAPSLYPTPVL